MDNRSNGMDNLDDAALLRLPQELNMIPVSRNARCAGCKNGRSPSTSKSARERPQGERKDIKALLRKLSASVKEYTQSAFLHRGNYWRAFLDL